MSDHSDIIMELPAGFVPTPEVEHIGKFRRSLAVGVSTLTLLGGTTLIDACSSSHSKKTTHEASPTTLSPNQEKEASQVCPDGFEINNDVSNSLKYVGASEAFFPSLGTIDSKGNVKLNNTKEARDSILNTLCNDGRALGAFTAYITEPREQFHLPDETTISRTEKLAELYSKNEQAALDAVKRAASVLDYLTPASDFAVTKNQAVNVEPDRVSNTNPTINGVKTVDSRISGDLTVFELDYNHDDPSLSAHQKNVLARLQTLEGFQANGILTIAIWLGENNVNLTPNTSPSTTVPAGAEQNQKNQKNQNQQNQANGGGGQQNGNNQGIGQTGGAAGPNGNNPEAGPGGVTNSPGQGGGETGGTTPGTTPNTTPGTTPNTTPVTTPNTTPHTTPTTTPQTTPVTKGTVPCDPNIAQCN